MKLGERIERRRIEIGISQAELARRVGVRQSTMNSLIKGDSRTSRSVVKIAKVLQTTPEYLMGETDDPSIDAAALALSASDLAWLDLLNALSPRDRDAVRALAQNLAGRSQTSRPFDGESPIPTLQQQRIEFKGAE